MTPELARRLLAAKRKLADAKAMIDLHTKAAAFASDELLAILSDPQVEQQLQADTAGTPDAVPVVTPGIRRVEVVGPMTVKAVDHATTR